MTQKTFAVAGVSKLAGTFKARFAADLTRVKVLEKNGHTDINLIELPEPMTKVEAAAHLIDTDFDKGNMEIRAALQAELDRFDAKSAKLDKPAKKAAAPAAVTEVPEEVVEAAREIAADMKPAPVRDSTGKFVKQTSPAAAAFQEWAEAANAEEAAEAEEEADIEF